MKRERIAGLQAQPKRPGVTCLPRVPAWLAALAVAVSIVSACNPGSRRSGLPPDAQIVLDAAIQDLDAGRYDELYQTAADEWRNQSSSDQSRTTLETLRQKLGRARTRNVQTAREEQTSSGPVPGHSITVAYQTSFDRGQGMESFTLVERNGRWALAKYYVSSSALK